MYPELLKLGPLTVYSYGFMLAVSFIVSSYILTKEVERKGLDANIASQVTLLAIIFGIAGSKLFSLLENWNDFLADPFGQIFSAGGLTFYGGLILSIIAIAIYLRRQKIPFLYIADAASPSLALAYGIGRIGCHLAGDGDYGIPTSLPWGVNYENGIVKPSLMFQGSDIAKSFPNGIVPNNTPLHPTPIYEFIVGVIIFYILWRLRKKEYPIGILFMIYLIFSGFARFFVEFIRLNPLILFGLSEAQLISIALILLGIIGIFFINKFPERFKFEPAPIKQPSPKHKTK
ncbi:MAG: prolipoprotein diacylglyceryl transferase [Ignavibacteriaceae bacterium]|jgi:phosphatidylglycerol:prolipoprotein diacylglycerol transferase|nr:prolipoprotein diacylglyceryl transferase [Ignavibacteriaceae bacterium]